MRLRTLRTRLLLWLIGAIVLAFGSSALVVGCSRPEAFATGAEVMAHTMSQKLEASWDDPAEVDAYVAQVRDVTGFDVRLWRDPSALPKPVRGAARRGQLLSPDGPERVFVPVIKDGKLVGALQMERYGTGFRPKPLWRLFLGLGAALVVLVVAARWVANQLAKPLEQLADAADRFGAGDLAFRTNLANPKSAREAFDVAVAFNKMADRLEATVRSQQELLGAISHELRSPLARAGVALEIARDRVASSGLTKVCAPLDEIERQMRDVDGILGDLLAVTRAGLADVRAQTFELLPWLEARLDEQPEVPKIVLEVAGANEPPARVAADAPLLGRALANLVSNAKNHGHPEGEPLLVRVVIAKGLVTITVRDRGPGFPEGFLARAFEPFVRADPARSRRPSQSGGSGLGLALVKRIAEAHGGRAFAGNVRDPEGAPVGAEVGIQLPLAKL